jgi:hypothetical protein
VAHQRIVEALRNEFQIGFGTHFLESVLCQAQLAGEHFHILLLEMPFDRVADQEAEQEQDRGRNRGEKQRQSKSDRSLAA